MLRLLGLLVGCLSIFGSGEAANTVATSATPIARAGDPPSYAYVAMAVADKGADSDPDVVVVTAEGGVQWFENHDAVMYEASEPVAVSGASDIVTRATEDGVVQLIVAGEQGVSLINGASGATTLLGTGSPAFGVALGDVDSDGAADVLFSMPQANTVAYFVGPDFETIVTLTEDCTDAGFVTMTALGVLVSSLHTTGALSWYLLDGTRQQRWTLPPDQLGGRAAAGDADGDGDIDFLLLTSEYVLLMEHINDGFFLTSPVAVGGHSFDGQVPTALLLLDLDLSGSLDVVVSGTNGTFWYPDTTGDAQLLSEGTEGTDVVAVALDVDGDGDMDLVEASTAAMTFVTIGSVPFAPLSVTATATGYSGQVELEWAASDNNGDSVQFYSVHFGDGNETATATTTGLTVDGLTDGVVYEFTVTATNSRGESQPSDPPVEAMPFAPVGIDATLASATLSDAAVILAADLDNDGADDLLIGAGSLFVAWGPAPWSTVASVYAGFPICDLVVTDLDDDGFLDLVAASTTNSVLTFINEQNRVFEEYPSVFFAAAESHPKSIALGDVNGDSYVDIAFLWSNGNAVDYFRGMAVSSAAPSVYFTVSGATTDGFDRAGTRSVDVAAIDSDASDDEVLIVTATEFIVFSGDGLAVFSYDLHNASLVRAADADGDGFTDVFVGTDLGELFFFANNEAGSLSATPVNLLQGGYGAIQALAFADLDYSGSVDVVIATEHELLWTDHVLSAASGAISLAIVDDADALAVVDPDDSWTVFDLGSVPLPPTDVVATATGFTGQVQLEWTAADDNGASVLYYTVHYAENETVGSTVEGLADGLAYEFTVTATTYRGTSAQSAAATATPFAPVGVAAEEIIDTGAGSGPQAVAAADLTGDGAVDLCLVTYDSGRVSIYEHENENQNDWVETIVLVSSGVRNPTDVAVGDLDLDGDLDVAVASFSVISKSVLLFFNDGNGSSSSFSQQTLEFDALPFSVRIGAVGDLVVSFYGADFVLVLTGPSFNASAPRASTSDTFVSPTYLELADLDSDGDLEVLVPCTASRDLRVYDGSSLGVATQAHLVGDSLTRTATSSVDGSVVVAGVTQVALFTNANDGTGTLTGPEVLDYDSGNARAVLWTDLDLDGALDILVASIGTGVVSYFDPDGNKRELAQGYDGAADLVATSSASTFVVVCKLADYAVALTTTTVPTAPANVTAVATGFSSGVRVSWTPSESDVDEFTVYANDTIVGTTTAQSYEFEIVSGLDDFVPYAFSVSATNFRGQGPASTPGVVATPYLPVAVTSVSSFAVSSSPMAAVILPDDQIGIACSTGSRAANLYDRDDGSLLSELTTGLGKPIDIAAGDLNGDGLIDLAVADYTTGDSVVLLINDNSTGGYAEQVIAVSAKVQSIRIGAVTADDDVPDLVLSLRVENEVWVLAGPDFDVSQPIVYAGDRMTSPMYLELADVNFDGQLDILVPLFASFYYFLWYDPAAADTEEPEDWKISGTELSAFMLAVDDRGNVAVGLVETVRYLANDGAGDFTASILGEVTDPRGLLFTDLDLDGTPDLVVTSFENSSVAWFDGDGNQRLLYQFGDGVGATKVVDAGAGELLVLQQNAGLVTVFSTATVPPAPANMTVVATGFSGVLQVAWEAADVESFNVYFTGSTSTTTTARSRTLTGLTNGVEYTVSVTAVNAFGESVAATAAATPFSPVEASIDSVFDRDARALTTTDVDGDGDQDLIAVAYYDPESVLLYRNNGGDEGWEEVVLSATIEHPVHVAADGDQIVVATAANKVLLLNATTGTQDVVYNGTSVVSGVAIDGTVVVSLFEEDQILFLATLGAAEGCDGPGPLELADLDGDGRLDVLVPCQGSDELMWFNGTKAVQTLAAGSGPRFASSAGGDVVLTTDSDVLYFANSPPGTLQPGVVVAAVADPQFVALHDLNLDGVLDILVASFGDDTVVWFTGSSSYSEERVLVDGIDGAYGLVVLDESTVAVSAWSALELAFVSVFSVPFAPTNLSVSVSPEDTQHLSWTAPDDNGAEITEYTIFVTTDEEEAGEALHLSVDGVTHELQVAASNYRGMGPRSAVYEYNSCRDGARTGNETDVDCGGPHCGACEAGESCSVDGDCANDQCSPAGTCASCLDSFLNQDETSVDCGGTHCGPCLVCTPGDYSALVQWDTSPVVVDGVGNVTTLNTTIAGVPNYEPLTITVQGAGAPGSCTVVPLAPTSFGDTQALSLDADSTASLGDVNGDGFVDVSLGAAVYLGNGSHVYYEQTFAYNATATTNVSVAGEYLNGTATAVSVCDYDGDGDDDALATDAHDRVWLVPDLDDGEAELTDWVGVPSCMAGYGVLFSSTAFLAVTFVALQAHPEPPTVFATTFTTLKTAVIEWEYPTRDGEAEITGYELTSTTSDPQEERWIQVNQTQEFQVRSVNSIGVSAWSDAVVFTEPYLDATATATAGKGELLIEWWLVEAPLSLVHSQSVANGTVVADLGCQLLEFNVSVNGGELWTAAESATPPVGVCPPVCSAAPLVGAQWIDPTGLDPFEVECDGNWTSLSGLSDGRRADVVDSSSEVVGDTWARTKLATNITAQPAEYSALPINVTAEVRAKSNTPAAVVEMRVDGSAWGVVSEYDDTAEGLHRVDARSVLAGGWLVDESPASAEWTYDVTAPSVSFVSRPALFSNQDTATFFVDATEPYVLFEYGIYNTSTVGSVKDSAVAGVEPSTYVISQSDSEIEVGTDSGTSLGVSVDSGDWSTQPLPDVSLELGDGWHSLQVRAVDADGNFDSSPLAFGVYQGADTVPPDTVVSGADADATEAVVNVTLALTLSLGEDEACVYQWSTDLGASWTTHNSTGDLELTPTELGWFQVAVRAVDSAGNVDPAPVLLGWNVVLPEPPDTFILTPPGPVVAMGASLTIELNCTSSPQDYEYSLDGGASWLPTASSVLELPEQNEAGMVFLLVRAGADPTPASAAWVVAEPPVATLALRPPAVSVSSMAVLAVAIEDGSGCRFPYTLSGAEGEQGPAIVLGPLPYGFYEIEIRPECDLPANTLSWQWEVTTDDENADISFAIAGLAEGEYEAWMFGTDPAGNEGALIEYAWTVDQTAPATILDLDQVPRVMTVSSLYLDANASEAGCLFNVSLDATWAMFESPIALHNVTEGLHALSVAAVDAALNSDPEPIEFEVAVDTIAPVLAVLGDAVSNAPQFVIECYDLSGCFNVTPPLGPYSPALEGQTDGGYAFNVTAQDAVGNVASLSFPFVLDTEPPQTVVWSGNEVTNASAWDVNATCVDLNRCWLNSSVALPMLDLAEGNHSVRLFAVDEAGNVDPAGHSRWVFADYTPPTLELVGVLYSPEGDSAEIDLDCDDATPCVISFDREPAGPDGNATVLASAVDAAGNRGDALAVDLLFDTVPPVVNFSVVPPAYSEEAVFVVEFEVVELNPAGACRCSPSACGEDVVVVADEAVVVYSVTCADVRDHVTTANATWIVDRVAPVVAIEDGWDGAFTNKQIFEFRWTVDDVSPSTTVCRLNDEVEEDCASPWQRGGATDGEYVLNVTATDALGHEGQSAVATFVLDTVAPDLSLLSAPPVATTEASVSLEFGCVQPAVASDACGDTVADPDCSLYFRLDGGAVTSTPDGALTLTVANYSSHDVELFGIDAAGNAAESIVVTWEYSETVIVPTITSGPALLSGVYTARFEWSEEAAEYEYRLDDGPWSTTTDTFAEVEVDDVGTFVFSVCVAGSNADTDTFKWEVAHCAASGKIEYLDDDGGLQCDGCPEGVTCLQGLAYIKEGWWWSHGAADGIRYGDEFNECRVVAACTTVLDENGTFVSPCATGYEGVLCDTCSVGYGRTLDLTCGNCGDADNSAVVGVAVTLFTVLLACIAVVVVRQSLKAEAASSTSAADGKKVRVVSTLKIMANYFLMMGILKDMDLDWGGMLNKLFSYMGVMSGSGAADLQLVNCVARVDTFDQFRLYFVIPAVLVFAPAAAIWGLAGARRLRWEAQGRPGGELGSLRIWGFSKALVYRQSLLVLGYFAYPVVVTNSFKVLYCDDIEGESRLVEDYSKLCSGPEYNALWGTALVYSTVLALGVPFGIFWMMRRQRSQLTQGKAKTQFFFFFGEFRPEWYWWEMTVMARKVAMGAIAVLMVNHEQSMQVYTGTWLLLFSFTAQIACGPHRDSLERLLESAAQGTVLASLLLGQGMAFEGVTDSQRATFEWTVLVLNVAVMNCLGLVLGFEAWRQAKSVVEAAKAEPPVMSLAPRGSSSRPSVTPRSFVDNPLQGRGQRRTTLAAAQRRGTLSVEMPTISTQGSVLQNPMLQ